MKAKRIKIINLIVAVLIALFAIGQAFAWFVSGRVSLKQGFGGSSAGAYFAYGDGSAEQPFGINTKYHMYNLAWLQNTGRLVNPDGTPVQYHFELDPDMQAVLNMDDMWLPPIGNDDNPFTGVFNGNGKTVANVKITTDKEKLTANPSSADYEFSNAVGLFGMTTKDSEISNFVLANPIVEAANINTKYAVEWNGDDADTHSKRVVGLAVGHVAGKCSSIGVHATGTGAQETQLDVKKAGYSTFNSILGELGAGVESSVTGGGHTAGNGGSGASFGSSFDVNGLRNRLNLIIANKKSSTPSFALPVVEYDSSAHRYNLGSGEKISFSINEEKSTYEGSNAREAVSDLNVGYFLGNQNKIYDTSMNFSAPLINSYNSYADANGKTPAQSHSVPAWLYQNTLAEAWWNESSGKYDTNNTSYNTDAQGGGFSALTEEEFEALPKNVKDVIPAQNEDNSYDSKTYATIRLSQTFQHQENASSNGEIPSTSNSAWSYHGQISYMGKTYGDGFLGTDGNLVDEDGNYIYEEGTTKTIKFYRYDKGVALPNCSIWFKPAEAGKVRFIMFTPSAGDGFALIQATRTNYNSEDNVDKSPFYIDPNSAGKDITFKKIMLQNIPSYVFLYYEYEIPQSEIDAGNVEYFLMEYGSGGAYFVYLDIGSSASEDTSGVDRDKAVSAIDFIYDGVDISQDDIADSGILKGDFIVTPSGASVKYEASKTSVYFEDIKNILKIVFVRLYSGNNADGKTIGITVTSDTPEEVTATYANYVLR